MVHRGPCALVTLETCAPVTLLARAGMTLSARAGMTPDPPAFYFEAWKVWLWQVQGPLQGPNSPYFLFRGVRESQLSNRYLMLRSSEAISLLDCPGVNSNSSNRGVYPAVVDHLPSGFPHGPASWSSDFRMTGGSPMTSDASNHERTMDSTEFNFNHQVCPNLFGGWFKLLDAGMLQVPVI